MTEKKAIKKEVVVDNKTTNPFNKGVSYADFLANVSGKVTVESLINKLNLDKPTKEWLETELKHYTNNKK